MKFGLMYEIQIPEPHYPGVEQERYKQIMAQVELADEEGFDYFWTVEHHFLNEFSHCSAPEVLYGALSQRTRRIRIGHAVALLPGQYNHPVRVAERAAVLDILSDGRMDLGTGRSTTLIEMDGFEVNPADTKAQWEEAISMISPDVDRRYLFSRRPVLLHTAPQGYSQAGPNPSSASLGGLQPARQLPGRRRDGTGSALFQSGGLRPDGRAGAGISGSRQARQAGGASS